jgi:hypothetical protein
MYRSPERKRNKSPGTFAIFMDSEPARPRTIHDSTSFRGSCVAVSYSRRGSMILDFSAGTVRVDESSSGTPGRLARARMPRPIGTRNAKLLRLVNSLLLVQSHCYFCMAVGQFRLLAKVCKENQRLSSARSATTDPNEHVFRRVSAAFVGRIDGVSPDIHAFHQKRTEIDRADFLGFGQMGLFDAEFVLQSVEGHAVLAASPPIPRAR